MTAGFLVRLDALMDGGMSEKHRALAVEQWERPPEEWERFRAVPRTSQGIERLTLQTPNGPVAIVPNSGVPVGMILRLSAGRRVDAHRPRRGIGLGTIQEDLDAASRVGLQHLRIHLAPPDYADLLMRVAELRDYRTIDLPPTTQWDLLAEES